MPPRSGLPRRLLLAGAASLASGCRTAPPAPVPAIKFTRIPKADLHGSDYHDIIEGTVSGARQGQQIVLYARNGNWWLQPLAEAPFTRVLPNAKWRNATHLGSHYAALLVDAGYRPEENRPELPAPGGAVAAVAVAEGSVQSPSPVLSFSGYEWRIRTGPSNRGGRNNPYSAANAFTTPDGALHLRIRKNGDRYECAEIALTRSLGYGTYSFTVRDISTLPQDLTFEMFTWDYSGTGQHNREMDIVMRRRSAVSPVHSARFVVQPFQVASNVHEFRLAPGAYTHSFRWTAGQIDFSTARPGPHPETVAQHRFTLGVPTPGIESARISLYLPHSAETRLAEGEVVIDRFEFTP